MLQAVRLSYQNSAITHIRVIFRLYPINHNEYLEWIGNYPLRKISKPENQNISYYLTMPDLL